MLFRSTQLALIVAITTNSFQEVHCLSLSMSKVSISLADLSTPNDIHSFWYEGYNNEELYNLANANVLLSTWFMGAGGADHVAIQFKSKKIIDDAANDLLTGDEWHTPKGASL